MRRATPDPFAALDPLSSLTAGVDTVEDAINALEDISTHVEEADAGVKEISQATAEQAHSAQSVTSMATS